MKKKSDVACQKYNLIPNTNNREHLPPQSMTMNRLEELDEVVLAQSTRIISVCLFCFDKSCCRPPINWIINDKHLRGWSPFELPNNESGGAGWIHEESSFAQRWLGCRGCQKAKFIQHSGRPPKSLQNDDWHCCWIQTKPTSDFLHPNILDETVIATHEKEFTLPTGCCCGTLPYLTTKDGTTGNVIGQTIYVCDDCVFVPKFHVLDKDGNIRYLLRPDTCLGEFCVRPQCEQGNNCWHVPFRIRDPLTHRPFYYPAVEDNTSTIIRRVSSSSQVAFLRSPTKINACYSHRHAYHIAFPEHATLEDRLTLIGSSILIDIALHEKVDNYYSEENCLSSGYCSC